jgi:hypothetical protein
MSTPTSLSSTTTSAAMTSNISSASSILSLFTASTETFATHLAKITDSAIISATPTSFSQHGQGHHDWKGNQDSEKTQRMVIIILSSVIGSIILLVSGLLLWHYYKRYQKRLYATRLAAPDESEFEKWRQSTSLEALTLEEQSVPGIPPAARRHSTQRYYSRPTSMHQLDSSQASPRSTSGLLQDKNPFDDRPYEYRDLPAHRHSTINMRGYMQHHKEKTKSTQSLTDRAPTPLFGNGQTPGESEEVPQIPSRKPARPRSIPMSPLAGSPMSIDFDFGFERKPAIRRSERFSIASSLSLNEPPISTPKHF